MSLNIIEMEQTPVKYGSGMDVVSVSDQSHPSSVKVEDELSYTSPPRICFMVCTEINSP
jgi:hypothetical protein